MRLSRHELEVLVDPGAVARELHPLRERLGGLLASPALDFMVAPTRCTCPTGWAASTGHADCLLHGRSGGE